MLMGAWDSRAPHIVALDTIPALSWRLVQLYDDGTIAISEINYQYIQLS